MESIKNVATQAKLAKFSVSRMSTTQKNNILTAMAKGLTDNISYILQENEKDILAAKEKGRTPALIDRLKLNEERINGMAQGLLDVVALKDPVGEIISGVRRPNGLQIAKRRVPMGVVGIIYEARPNVTADAVGLCIKSGNSVVLKGGSEAIFSNIAISDVMIKAGNKVGLPDDAIVLIKDTSREAAAQMMKLNGVIDVLIPRGGAGLIRTVVENATVPVIETGTGNCHIFIDESANFTMAKDIVINAKTTRPAVCNAAESLLVHKDIAQEFLPLMFSALKEKDVQIRGCEQCQKFGALPADEDDYYTEFLDYIISVKVVDDINEAINHINKYSTSHSEAIVTEKYENAETFLNDVDSAAVYVNASTRFTDGFEFGFGAEIGISTQKLHARGPMGLEELTTAKYVINGNGQIR